MTFSGGWGRVKRKSVLKNYFVTNYRISLEIYAENLKSKNGLSEAVGQY